MVDCCWPTFLNPIRSIHSSRSHYFWLHQTTETNNHTHNNRCICYSVNILKRVQRPTPTKYTKNLFQMNSMYVQMRDNTKTSETYTTVHCSHLYRLHLTLFIIDARIFLTSHFKQEIETEFLWIIKDVCLFHYIIMFII